LLPYLSNRRGKNTREIKKMEKAEEYIATLEKLVKIEERRVESWKETATFWREASDFWKSRVHTKEREE